MTSSTSDRIRLTGLSARGYHGVLPAERAEGQVFIADVELRFGPRGTALAAATDDLSHTLDYGAVAAAVVAVIEGEPVNLLETLAARIADAVLAFGQVSEVEVSVHKPQAPLAVAFDDVVVTITRTASEAGLEDASLDAAAGVAALVGGELGSDLPAAVPPVSAPAPMPVAVPAAMPAAAAPVLAAPEPESAPALPEVESAAEVSPAVGNDEEEAAEAPEIALEPEPEPVSPLDLRPEHPVEAVLALGGNVGGVVPALRKAVHTLSSTPGVEVTAVAPLARTAAVLPEGGEEQPDYLNTVVLVATSLAPRELLTVCQGLENAAGRVRTTPKGPRTLDVDVITYEGVTSEDPELTLPHPAAAQRAFVLVPWAQADPFAEIGDAAVATLAEEAPDRDGVRWLALDWLDSDHLPALPTGQYVAPPLAEDAAEAEPVEAPEPAEAESAEPEAAPAEPAQAEAGEGDAPALEAVTTAGDPADAAPVSAAPSDAFAEALPDAPAEEAPVPAPQFLTEAAPAPAEVEDSALVAAAVEAAEALGDLHLPESEETPAPAPEPEIIAEPAPVPAPAPAPEPEASEPEPAPAPAPEPEEAPAPEREASDAVDHHERAKARFAAIPESDGPDDWGKPLSWGDVLGQQNPQGN